MKRQGCTDMQKQEGVKDRPFFHLNENEAVVVLAKDKNCYILINQYRKPVDSHVVQLPGGGVEKGESLEEAAKREFLEETGYECKELTYLGNMLPASWRTNEITHVCYTEKVEKRSHQQLESHETIEVHRVSVEETVTNIQRNVWTDSELCFALLQAHVKGYVSLGSET
ncbi:NUDIX hydrolase [Salsuginibacillus kocurii]|uniref:NUDIX hydrolase n=1 Tax=Salsuginibacillus kocurii TaxID=427078 RepID=UPI00037431C8|nr:NUDIX hydrolase [Salsuginibacillus kocurii]